MKPKVSTLQPTSTGLATIANFNAIVPVEFFKEGGSNDILTMLETEVRAQAANLDISTKAGREAIASLAYKVSCSKKPLEDLRKALTEDIRKQKEAIDKEGRKADLRIDALRDEVRKDLTDWEQLNKDRIFKHEENLRTMQDEAMIPFGATTTQIEAAMLKVAAVNPATFEEFVGRASALKTQITARLKTELQLSQQADKERAEIEQMRAEAAARAVREHDEAVARAARDKAEAEARERAQVAQRAAEVERQRIETERFEAEARAKQAEAERIAAAEKAVRELQESEERRLDAERKAEQHRIDAEKRAQQALRDAEARRVAEAEAAELAASAAAAKAERERYAAVEAERQRVAAQKKAEADEAEKRAKNRAHLGAVNREVLAALAKLGIPEDIGKDVITAIVKGSIPHVTINY